MPEPYIHFMFGGQLLACLMVRDNSLGTNLADFSPNKSTPAKKTNFHTKPSSLELRDRIGFWTIKEFKIKKIKILKHIAVKNLTKTIAMVPLSGQFNLAGQHL
jgi:hypothetical protein